MVTTVRVEIQRAPGTEDLPLPAYQTRGAAGMDLCAALGTTVTLPPGERIVVPTGIHIAVPNGYEAQIRGRSGLARKYGIGLVNGVGTIDSDYTGEVQVLLINHGKQAFEIRRGDRIAQMVIAPIAEAVWSEVESLVETVRGTGGFGHTGTGQGKP